MATITDAKISISHDHTKKTARPIVTCKVNFTPYEMSQMKLGLQFKLVCKLWGADSGLTGSDDFLFTYGTPKYFPDVTPNATENVNFDTVLGEGVLDEDWGVDEVYGKLYLRNLYTLVQVTQKTNTVSHSF